MSKVGARSPSDLTVAYLAGPEPMNDFKELVALGVHPHNIYGFESDNETFNKALVAAKRSDFPLLKIIKMPLDRYLQAVPCSFDIIYFDACGPFPSTSQKTLRTVANIFRYQRLNSLGVLVTNFAGPDLGNESLTRSYADLVAAYLYPREMLESEDPEWNLTEGANAYGKVPKKDGDESSFFHEVLRELPRYYGNYVTRQLFDLASLIVPLSRLAAGGLWETLFAQDVKTTAKAAQYLKHFDEEDEGGSYIVDANMNALGWTMTALLDKHEDVNYPVVDEASRKLLDVWGRELAGSPDFTAQSVVDAYMLLRDSQDPGLLKPAMRDLVLGYRYLQNMHMFCDLPTGQLALFPTMAQFSYPSHYNVEETRRYRYIADGKSTDMFLDVIPFDTCRYLYDWLPSTELVTESFDFEAHQLVYRFAMDALLKHSIRYNNEYVFGGHVVGWNEDGYSEKLLTPRERL